MVQLPCAIRPPTSGPALALSFDSIGMRDVRKNLSQFLVASITDSKSVHDMYNLLVSNKIRQVLSFA